MKDNVESLFDEKREYLKLFRFFLVCLSIFFAINTVGPFLALSHSSLVWFSMVVGLLIVMAANFYLSKRYPKRFYSYDVISKNSSKIRGFLFFPPFSTFFYSFGLIVFILHFFTMSVATSWRFSLEIVNEMYGLFGEGFIFVPLSFISIILGTFLCLYLALNLQGKLKIKDEKFLISVFFSIILSLWLYWAFNFLVRFNEEIFFLSIQTIRYFAVFVPLHWFYLLFMSSRQTEG